MAEMENAMTALALFCRLFMVKLVELARWLTVGWLTGWLVVGRQRGVVMGEEDSWSWSGRDDVLDLDAKMGMKETCQSTPLPPCCVSASDWVWVVPRD